MSMFLFAKKNLCNNKKDKTLAILKESLTRIPHELSELDCNLSTKTDLFSTILFIVSIKIGTKKIRSVYYSSFMKLIVSTFLVYKVKKCLLKSGKVTFCYFKSRNRIKQGCPSLGHRVPTLWASVAQGLSIVSPSLGPSLFVFSSSTYEE